MISFTVLKFRKFFFSLLTNTHLYFLLTTLDLITLISLEFISSCEVLHLFAQPIFIDCLLILQHFRFQIVNFVLFKLEYSCLKIKCNKYHASARSTFITEKLENV